MGNKIELLAPAGSYEAFEAALGAGADAVYVGGASFGARAYAPNFDREELIRAIRTAHIHNRKLYLTVNTLLKNRELEEDLHQYLTPYYEAGLDAVIVQDLGVLRYIRRNFPGLPIHASTQMTVTGPEGMKFLEQQGVVRVVPARELSLAEIERMHRASPLEIEVFIHGALCYSYSGQCLMSSILGGRSGNRGRCAQPCRLPYQVSKNGNFPNLRKEKKEYCPLSLKDICTLDLLPEIISSGAVSLKIEGRMKQPQYTAGVTGMYRKYLDILLKDGESSYQVKEEDRRYLLDIFNRGGSCSGYYKQQNGSSMMAFSNEKKTGDSRQEIIKSKEKIYGNFILFAGSPAILEVSSGDTAVTVSGAEVQEARNHPMEKERILQQMNRLGNTEFEWESLEISMGDHIFISVGAMNEIRRSALDQLSEKLWKKWERNLPPEISAEVFAPPSGSRMDRRFPLFYASCEKFSQAEALLKEEGISGMYLPFDAMEECMKRGYQKRLELYLALPHMTRGNAPKGYFEQAEKWISEGMKGFLVRNLESYAMLKKLGFSGRCVTDASLYTWNEEASAFWREEGILRDTIPLELNEKELRHRDNRESEMIVYGYLPLMLSAQCVRKNVFGCDKQEGEAFLKDRYGKVFPSVCHCRPWKTQNTDAPEICYNIIYNSLPMGLLKEAEQVRKLRPAALRLSFTMEKPEEAAAILKEFLLVYGSGAEPSEREYTKGHFKRGAE